MNKKLLLIDDDKNFRDTLKSELESAGFMVEARQSMSESDDFYCDYAVLDLRLKGEYGLDAIPKILEVNPECRIIMLSGYSSVASAVKAMKLGAINYLTKPVSIETIVSALEGNINLEEESEQLHTLSSHEHEYIEFVLEQNGGNISKTAKVLGLHRQSLQRKLKKYR